MEQAAQGITPWVLIGFNVVLSIASLFGGLWLRRVESDMTELRKAITAHGETMHQRLQEQSEVMHERLADKVGKDDFREFRAELRENFKQVFTRMDTMNERMAEKADRS